MLQNIKKTLTLETSDDETLTIDLLIILYFTFLFNQWYTLGYYSLKLPTSHHYTKESSNNARKLHARPNKLSPKQNRTSNYKYLYTTVANGH